MREQVHVLAPSGPMLLATHRTPIRGRLTAVTVETVVLGPARPDPFSARARPGPPTSTTFTFTELGEGTSLTYTGELGTDLWALGERWGDLVTPTWENTMHASLNRIKAAAEGSGWPRENGGLAPARRAEDRG